MKLRARRRPAALAGLVLAGALGAAGCSHLDIGVGVGTGGVSFGVGVGASIWDFVTGGGGDDAPPAPQFATLGQCLNALSETDLSWRRVADIDGRGRCGVAGAVRVTGGAGIQYSQAITLTCEMAHRVHLYQSHDVQRAAQRRFGQSVTGMETISGYSCRTIRGTDRLSQHGLGKAIDIRGVTLADGRRIALPAAWNAGGAAEAFMQDMHRAGCARFHGALGPEADKAHADHFHFDIGPYTFCR